MAVIRGTGKSEVITGTSGDDTIIYTGGDDTLNGGAGSDTYSVSGNTGYLAFKDSGTSGTDRVLAGSNGTQINLIGFSGASGIEEISANGYSNVVIQNSRYGGLLDFSKTTLTGITQINGGDWADTIIGSAGNDTIRGGTGDDTLDGGNGSDTYLVGGTVDGFDTYKDSGTSGTDRILATQAGTVIGLNNFTASNGIEEISANGFGNVILQNMQYGGVLDLSKTTLTGIAQIAGSSWADTITGSAGNDTIVGGADDDTLDGGNGSDTYLIGGTGDGFDTFRDSGTSGTDRILATQAGTVIGLTGFTAQSGIEEISANGFSNVAIQNSRYGGVLDLSKTTLTGISQVNGSAWADTITGSAGNDTIRGGAGDDTLDGGNGNDTYLVGGTGEGFDTYKDTGTTGTDRIVATQAGTQIGLRGFNGASGIEEISANGFANVTIKNAQYGGVLDLSKTTLTGIAQVVGDSWDDTITGSAGNDKIVGGSGNDILAGGGGTDTAGYSGNYSSYKVTVAANGDLTVQDLRGVDGTDLVKGFSYLQFADRTVAVSDLLPKQVDTTASAPTLTVGAASGNEDTAIALNVAAALTDLDGSESLAISISGVPTGAKLSAGTNLGNGTWSLTPAQLGGLTITPPANSDVDFALTVTATSTESNGGAKTSTVATLPVTVAAVADAPTLSVSPASGVANKAVALNIAAALTDTDGSETLTVTVAGVPTGATLSAGTNQGNGVWTLTQAQLQGLQLVPAANSPTAFSLTVTATSTEADSGQFASLLQAKTLTAGSTGATSSVSADLGVTLQAVDTTASAPTLTATAATGQEDKAIALNVTAALTDTDGSETLAITIAGVPTGATLSAGTNQGNGTWALTPAQLAGLTITPPANSDADFSLTVTATSTETNGGAKTSTVATLPVTVNAVADAPTLTVAAATGTANTAIALNIASALTDTDGSESLAVTIAGVPTGATLSAGTNQGNGTWSLTKAQLAGLTITPPTNSDVDFTLSVTATSTESVGGSQATTSANLAVTVNPSATPLTIYGTTANDTVTGTAGDDIIDGRTGADTMIGGAGNDTYMVDNASDVVVENAGGGTADRIVSTLNQAVIQPNVEILELAAGAGNATIWGSDAGETLIGNSGDNIIFGRHGNDTMIGGAGNDIYQVDDAGDVVIENANEGIDFVGSYLGNYVLGANIENGAIGLTTGARLEGNALNNTLYGGAGNDTLVGGGGNDVLIGRGGVDTAVFSGPMSAYSIVTGADGNVTVSGSTDGVDVLQGISFLTFANTTIAVSSIPAGGIVADSTASAPTLAVSASTGTVNSAIALNIAAALTDLDGSESLAVKITGVPTGAALSAGTNLGNGAWSLTQAQLAGLTITPAANDETDFSLTVTATSTEANGGATTSVSGTLGVTVNPVSSAPVIYTPTITGNYWNEVINGTTGNDVIRAAGGDDTVNGGNGSDTYLVGGTNDGVDTYNDSGTSGVDRIVATQSGTQIGLNGFSAASGIEEISGNGFSNVTIKNAWRGGVLDLSNTKLTGIAQINGDIYSDTITGSGSNDTIAGGAGDDTLDGGNGSDTYLVGGTNDGIDTYKDTGTSGNDRILATQAGTQIGLNGFSATSGIEEISANGFSNVTIKGAWGGSTLDFSNTILTGIAQISGDVYADVIKGSAGNDTIAGGAGDDTLDGGNGSDTYLVGGTNDGIDTYRDTGTSGNDRILATQPGTQIGLSGFSADSGIEEISANGFANVTIKGAWGGSVLDFSSTKLTGIAQISGDVRADYITGSAGNDSILGADGDDLLTGGAGNDYLDGGNGTDTAAFSGNYADYTVVKNTDGSWQVTGVGGNGLADGSDTLNSIEFLKFADKTYTLTANGPVLGGAVPSTGGSTSGASSGGVSAPLTNVIHTPDVPVATGASDVVGFTLQNTSTHDQAAATITFGQVFAKGDVMPGTHLVAVINGVEIPVQMDVKATNDDGSVRHAILTMNAPSIAAGGEVDMMLKEVSGTTGTAALTPQDALTKGLNVTLDINLHNADGSTTLKSFSAADLLTKAIANHTVETWLSGPQASEFRVEATITTGLTATFDIRVQADGNIHTDVIVANDSTFTAGIHSFTYDVTLKQAGQVAYSEANLFQQTNSTWHQELWAKGEPAINVQHDVEYLIKTGAVPAIDTSLGVSSQAIQDDYNAMQLSDTSPLGAAMVTQYMPMTGGRADIGDMPEWYTRYLLTQDARAYDVMIANANAAGSVPWHYTDEATGDPVRVDQHPALWIDDRRVGAGSIPDVNAVSDYGGWTPDVSHPPALSYLPYLMTGSHYYLDELQAQAAFEIASRDPGYELGTGILNPENEQGRALAWTLRDLMDAAYLTPDGDPMKAYFEGLVNANLKSLVDAYVVNGKMDAAGQIEGWIESYNSFNDGALAPWQQDYLATVLGQAAARGYDSAATLMQWMENFSAGRFINGDQGFNPAEGPGYYYALKDASGHLIDTWAELYSAVYDPATANANLPLDGYPDSPGGYAANARAALANFVSVTGSSDAVEAYGYVISQTQNIALPGFQYTPQWNMTPKLADGTYLNASDILVDSGTGTNHAGTAGNELIYGGTGDNTISGGGGIDMLFGGAGNDVVKGDAGNDYVFGNAGNDTLAGGTGNDILKGGSGADRFVYAAGDGKDEIVDFTPAEGDTIQLTGAGAYGVSNFSQLQSHMTQDSTGVLITLDQNNSIHLQGATIAQLAASSFIFN